MATLYNIKLGNLIFSELETVILVPCFVPRGLFWYVHYCTWQFSYFISTPGSFYKGRFTLAGRFFKAAVFHYPLTYSASQSTFKASFLPNFVLS